MSKRLQILVPPELDSRVRKAAQREKLSQGAWIRRAIERSLQVTPGGSPVDRLKALAGPTGDIEEVLADLARARREVKRR
jgi:hypothetical protein